MMKETEMKTSYVPEYFGCLVFDDRVMRARLSADIYHSLKKTVKEGQRLDSTLADAVAKAMKDWATEQGATHFTHWFQPLTGITAEKHDSFISPAPDGGVIMDFSGKELIKGEPDASSFPSGGLRATFEARGYTAWDPTSPAFIKDKTLCIPTAFCSYSGEALDKKTPLLRSMQALNKQALRILKLFGNTEVKYVRTSVGPEQEYFLIDRQMYEKREDLKLCGRTLFGAMPPKGQEMDDHYFGVLKPRVAAFMRDLDNELWKLGVLAKTEHNEVAPAQHELAPIFTTTNIAADHNQLTMEMMKKTALRHGLVCLLHEKPFDGVNGSGKHNNWSLSTDTGLNFLSPGKNPGENLLFMLTLAAVIRAVDEHQDLLRISVATAGNDHRLGANEAPPAIISMFLGDELTELLYSIASGQHHDNAKRVKMTVGADIIPYIRKDNTDRNRTSPFAFTGNKFEFRMLGSSSSVSCTNVVLNTAVAEELKQFADELEGAANFEEALHELIKKTVTDHKRIIFNGNGYDDAWIAEAEKRGLLNLRSTPECLPYSLHEKNMKLFISHKVYSETEMRARYEILSENYCKIINIEALTMIDMAKKDILPAVSKYSHELSDTVIAKAACGDIESGYEKELLAKVSKLNTAAYKKTEKLEQAVLKAKEISETQELSMYYKDAVFAAMSELRITVDELETMVPAEIWPYPSYGDMLFSVK